VIVLTEDDMGQHQNQQGSMHLEESRDGSAHWSQDGSVNMKESSVSDSRVICADPGSGS